VLKQTGEEQAAAQKLTAAELQVLCDSAKCVPVLALMLELFVKASCLA
jgi:hypothetical protein